MEIVNGSTSHNTRKLFRIAVTGYRDSKFLHLSIVQKIALNCPNDCRQRVTTIPELLAWNRMHKDQNF